MKNLDYDGIESRKEIRYKTKGCFTSKATCGTRATFDKTGIVSLQFRL